MIISSSAPNIETVGNPFTVECYVTIDPYPLPENVPSPPHFEWFFGSTADSLPSGVTTSPVTMDGNTYTSSLHFSPLQASHAGVYTCQLGGNERLAASTVVSVNANTSINYTVVTENTNTGINYIVIHYFVSFNPLYCRSHWIH